MEGGVRTTFISFNKDFLGFAASFLCAIHCAALPIILAFSALSGLSFLANHTIEFVFVGVSLVLAAWSLYPSFKNKHHSKEPLVIAAIGFAVLFGARFLPCGSWEGHITTAIGGLLIAISHFRNWRLVKKHDNSVCC